MPAASFCPEVILASASPRRAEILSKCGLLFRVEPSRVDEQEDPYADPLQLVTHNAQLKALAVVQRFPKAAVVAADTVVLAGKIVLGKPKDLAEALSMLERYRTDDVAVYTGLALCYGDQLLVGLDKTTIHIRKEFFDDYVAMSEQLFAPDKSGGFTIEGIGSLLFDNIHGSYYNVLGFPVHLFYQFWKQLGLKWPDA